MLVTLDRHWLVVELELPKNRQVGNLEETLLAKGLDQEKDMVVPQVKDMGELKNDEVI